MATKNSTKNSQKKVRIVSDKPKTQLRYANQEHYDLIQQARKKSGLTLNGWIVQATMRQARAELGL